MPSPIYQYVIELIMRFPIRRGPGVFMNISVREHAILLQIYRFEMAQYNIHSNQKPAPFFVLRSLWHYCESGVK
jgi:hypothetical protein